MKLILAALALSLLSGCAYTDQFRSAAAGAYDEGIAAAERFICNDASIGSIKRRYGTPERALVWKEFCSTTATPDISK